MAASIYATPPPDLSNEDTALSDVSNNSAAATAATTTTNNNSSTTLKSKPLTTTTITSPAATSSSGLTNKKSNINSNNNNSSSNNQTPEIPSIADVLKDTPSPNATAQCSSNQPSSVGNSSKNVTDSQDIDGENVHNERYSTTTTTAVTAMAAMQLQLLEAINDAAKKRHKQNNPSRMEDEDQEDHERISRDPSIDYEDKLSKMLLPKSMEQLKETFEFLQQQQQQQQQQNLENISKTREINNSKLENQQHLQHSQQQLEQSYSNPYHTFCKECGENFENEFKLSLHMLQEHNDAAESFARHQSIGKDMSALDILTSVKVKLERPECESPSLNHIIEQAGLTNEQTHPNNCSTTTSLTNGKDQQQQSQTQRAQHQTPWVGAASSINPMGFPFSPEAAATAALQAGGYLPLLALPTFPGVDGLSRPPLRIFNPEAFCELCNKEFCNKYFLKTHKANKHGIYDPSTEALSSQQQQQQQNNMNAMNQMFQMQMQQQHQHIQQQQQQMQLEMAQQQQKLLINEQQQRKGNETPTSTSTTTATITSGTNKTSQSSVNSQATTPPGVPQPVFCDICSKRFTNVFAMRRHRSKIHEQAASNNTSQRNSPSDNASSLAIESNLSNDALAVKQFQMPEGFRHDFVLEQEEVSFTPQPRKLSPQSQQQAREANFAHDKLKRLGVINPEAFCEICCKEYCNKYFLRTHKWKRHGIFMPPEESESSQKLPTWPFMNITGMPVNLMMAQRMMTTGQDMLSEDLQPSKRIKLEKPDEDEPVKDTSQDENRENRSENHQASSPEANKQMNSENQNSEMNMGLQNLQKLQTMIQQLNDLNGKRTFNCHFCGREMENQYALQAHIVAEHTGGVEGSIAPLNFSSHLLMHQQSLLKQSPNGSPTSLMPLMSIPGTGELRCTPCEREFNTLSEFQKHIAEVHLLTSSSDSPLREGFITPERPINATLGQGTRPPYTITPTSSYCEICNKELCNKYFMKTHMQRMHGIEIENGAQIGGVVCNICNKELCSKYFLRVHKHNTHGIIEEGAPLPQPRQNGLNLETTLQQQLMETDVLNRNLNMSPFGSAGSEGKGDTYNEACSLCSRRFRNSKWLRSHLLSEHGASGLEKVHEMDQQYGGSLSKPSSPTLKISNGASSSGSTSATPTAVHSPVQLAQALQNLNAQHLIKNNMATSFANEQNLHSPQLKEYQCSMCPFTTPYYAFLFIHERTHSIINNNERQKEQETEQEEEVETLDHEKEQTTKCEGEKEKNYVGIELNRDSRTSTEVITLDNDECENEHENKEKLRSNETEPTNLSIRTPSPTEIPSTKSLEAIETFTNSPKANEKNEIKPSSSLASSQRMTIAAQSPVFNQQLPQEQQQLLQQMAQQTGKIATFAIPRFENNSSNAEAPQMQAFVMEAAEQNEETNRFVPAIVYLPVRERITGTTMKLSFNLKPV